MLGSIISVDPLGKRGSIDGLLDNANAPADEYSVVIQCPQVVGLNDLSSLLASRQSDQDMMAIDCDFTARVVDPELVLIFPVNSASIVTPKKSANDLSVDALGSLVLPDKILCRVG